MILYIHVSIKCTVFHGICRGESQVLFETCDIFPTLGIPERPNSQEQSRPPGWLSLWSLERVRLLEKIVVPPSALKYT